MKKSKLELKKRTIATLSDSESKNVLGGEAVTTSFSRCTNFVCCGDGCTTTTQIKTIYPDPCQQNSNYTWCKSECLPCQD